MTKLAILGIYQMNPILHMYFLRSWQGHWSAVHVLIFFLNTAWGNFFCRECGISFQIYRTSEESIITPKH